MPSTNPASRFLLLGEPLSLDLVNTCIRRNGADVDLLDTPAALGAWLRAVANRLSWAGPASTTDWHAVRTLRTAIAELFRARREHTPPAAGAVVKVSGALSAPSARMRLVWVGPQPRLVPLSARARRSALLGELAADAVAVLTGPQARPLRECANPDCILQFVASNPRRRWCSSALCGNRARVARHYRLHHGAE
ncbi:MAG: CGNR zinc finger domain-containing protein [Rhodanobacteraceae bacterium]